MMNRIRIRNFQKKVKINRNLLIKIAKKTLKHERIGRAELSVSVVNDKLIKKLNKKYLNKKKATDVLAFRMADGEFAEVNPQILGDVVICADTAVRISKGLKVDVMEELSLYLIHGILHLAGHDDRTKKGFLIMQRIQREILLEDA